jgi:hypothetical protein
MTLGCGALAGNSTSDNVGPQHLINIKRLAYTVRKPEEAFEMPLDYNKAPDGAVRVDGPIDREAVVAAVEKYLASRGVGVRAAQANAGAPAAGSCGCGTGAAKESTIASVAAEVIDRILAGRGSQQGSGGYS